MVAFSQRTLEPQTEFFKSLFCEYGRCGVSDLSVEASSICGRGGLLGGGTVGRSKLCFVVGIDPVPLRETGVGDTAFDSD